MHCRYGPIRYELLLSFFNIKRVEKENAAKQTLDQLHERGKQVVTLHKRGIKITNVVEMTDLNYPAVFIAVTQNHVFARAGNAVNHAVGVPVVTVELLNSTRTALDAKMRQMWLDLLRWMSERAGERLVERVGPVGAQQRWP